MVSNPTYDPNALVSPSHPGRATRLLQLHPEGPRGLLPPAPDRHPGVLLPRVDHEGGDVHRRLQPQAVPGGVRLPGRSRARPSPTRTGSCATTGPTRATRAVRRDDDVRCSRSRATPATASSGCRWASPRCASRPSCSASTRCRASTCPASSQSQLSCRCPPNAQAFQAYTAIGQEIVQDTALQNAMVAAGHRQRRRAHDAAPHVVHPRLAGGARCRPTPRSRCARSATAAGGAAGDLPDGGRRRQRHGVGRRLPVLPVRRGQDGDGADRRDPGAQPTTG